MLVQAKRCTQCHVLKELDQFSKSNRNTDGLRSDCKDCAAHYKRKYYDSLGARAKKLGQMLHRSKYMASRKMLPFDLDKDFIENLATDQCPLLGIELDWEARGLSPSDNSPSLDRINSNLGYTKDNVWIVSHRANRIKNNATIEELLRIAESFSEKVKSSRIEQVNAEVDLF